MPIEMLINVSEGEECRIAIVEDGKLEELYMERSSSTSHVGNIYRGRVTNVEASIQAAFVDFGLGRNGFLHISDLMPTYFGRKGEDIQESVGRKMARRDRPPIQRCLRRGDEIIVQIIKEGIGTKGPTLSSYLSIPGRILVMMPGMANKGVSKKIEDDAERRRLRLILDGLKPPKDVGFIIRTAGIDKSKAEIQRDFTYLTRLWSLIEKKLESGSGPMELYTEGDLVSRTVRDVYSADIERIVVDNKEVAKRVKDVIKLANPRAKDKVELYEDPIPLFHKYDIEKDIEMMHSRHVPLPGGGSLVIDSTEAIVAIDINSGKFRDHSDAETTAFKTDMEAAEEIPRQLRLRDLGGVIICDFIDLRYERHRRELEQKLHDKFKNDRAKTKVLQMSEFGIIEMTRQRMRPSLKRSVYADCPHCKGAGLVKTPESMSLDVMRRLAIASHDDRVVRVELVVHPDAAFYLTNRKRASLANLEHDTGKPIVVRADHSLAVDEAKLELFDGRDGKIYLTELGMAPEAAPIAPGRRHQQGSKPDGRSPRAGAGRADNRNRGPQPQGRRREADPMEQKFDLDRGEEAVDEREEEREDDSAETPLKTSPPARSNAPQERPESYSNFTDNDVDLGDDEPEEEQGSPVASQPPRGDQRGRGRDDRPDFRRDQQPRGQRDGRGEGRGDNRGNQPPRNNQPNQRQDQRPNRQDNRQDNRNDSRNARPDSRNNNQRPDPRRDDHRNQPQGQRPPQGQQHRPPQGAPLAQGMASQGEGDAQLFDDQVPTGEAGEGGQRRRRRRRGGRGRNRNRNRQDGMQPTGSGDDQRSPSEFGSDEDHGSTEDMQHEDHFEPSESSRNGGGDREEHEERQPFHEEPPVETPSSIVEAPVEAEVIEEQPVEEAPAKATKSKGRKKAAAPAAAAKRAPRGRAKKPAAAKAGKEPAKRGEKKSESPVAETIVRTGSTDRHQLIVDESDEEPLVPSPAAPRPRTYRDLDEIPDDLD